MNCNAHIFVAFWGCIKDFRVPMFARLSGLDIQHGRASLDALHNQTFFGGDKLPQNSRTHFVVTVGVELAAFSTTTVSFSMATENQQIHV